MPRFEYSLAAAPNNRDSCTAVRAPIIAYLMVQTTIEYTKAIAL